MWCAGRSRDGHSVSAEVIEFRCRSRIASGENPEPATVSLHSTKGTALEFGSRRGSSLAAILTTTTTGGHLWLEGILLGPARDAESSFHPGRTQSTVHGIAGLSGSVSGPRLHAEGPMNAGCGFEAPTLKGPPVMALSGSERAFTTPIGSRGNFSTVRSLTGCAYVIPATFPPARIQGTCFWEITKRIWMT